MRTQTKDTQASTTPEAALEALMQGNERFRARRMADRDLMQQVSDTSTGQFPFAVVLTCIDSRTPPELFFDQGLGDVFTIRLAGNIVNEDVLGSMEFACKVAGAKLVLVVGHSHCGAVKGACDGVRLGNLTATMEKLEPVVERVRDGWTDGDATSGNVGFVSSVVERNVTSVLDEIRSRSEVLRELADAGDIALVGGIYDVESGAFERSDG